MGKSTWQLYASIISRRLFSHIGFSYLNIRFRRYNFFERSGFTTSGQSFSIAARTAPELKIHFSPANLSKNTGEVFQVLTIGIQAACNGWRRLVFSSGGPEHHPLRTEYMKKAEKFIFRVKNCYK
jgi:hypothetical protein